MTELNLHHLSATLLRLALSRFKGKFMLKTKTKKLGVVSYAPVAEWGRSEIQGQLGQYETLSRKLLNGLGGTEGVA